MSRQTYDTFVLSDLNDVVEDEVTQVVIRDLTPADRRYKYRSFYVNAKISKNAERYPDALQVRLGRGQLTDETWSIEVSEFLNKFE